jgi:hypothetical protein
MVQNDLGDKTVREILEKSIGQEAAGRVMAEVNDAHKQGKRGEDLHLQFRDAMKKEGHEITSDKSDILYGFIAPAVIA